MSETPITVPLMPAPTPNVPAPALNPIQPPNQSSGLPAMQQDPRAEILAQMKDIHLPEPIGWWPIAPGWWLLLALIAGSLYGAFSFWYKRHKQFRYRKEAIHTFNNLQQESHQLNSEETLRKAMILLKRVFISAYPLSRSFAPSLYGEQWLPLLRTTSGKPLNIEGLDGQLNRVSYANENNHEIVTQFLEALNTWIFHHENLSHDEQRMLFRKINKSTSNSMEGNMYAPL